MYSIYGPLNPFSKGLRFNRINSILLTDNLSGGQPIPHRLDGWSRASKFHCPELAAVHELHPFAKLALLESGTVSGREGFPGFTETFNAVNTVNRRIQIIKVLKCPGLVNVPNSGLHFIGRHDALPLFIMCSSAQNTI